MANFTKSPRLSDKFATALAWAADKHRYQRIAGVPTLNKVGWGGTAVRRRYGVEQLLFWYFLRLDISLNSSVASLVLEFGGNEDSAIAALAHDAVEDVGVNLSEIENFAMLARAMAVIAKSGKTKYIPGWMNFKLY